MSNAIAFGDRHEKPIAWAGAIWLGISTASWIPWMPIPDIPYVTDTNSWVLSGAWNTIWWGFVHPALEKHRGKMAKLSCESHSETEPDTKSEL